MTRTHAENAMSPFGPLVRWELVRLARRGHAARARVLLLYGLLLALLAYVFVWSYPVSPVPMLLGTASPLEVSQAADLARRLALVLLEAQLLLVAVVTPGYAAAAVSEEKDRHTLPLLLTTQLTDREIVWGKAVARAVFVLAAVACGVPVLTLTLLLGGVDPTFLAAGYALTTGTVVLSVGIGVRAACRTPDSSAALVRAYVQSAALVGGVPVPLFVLLSPFAMLAYYLELQDDGWRAAVGLGYPLGQVVLACALLGEAAGSVRRAGPTAGAPTPTAFPEPPRGRPDPVVIDLAELEPAPALPPLDSADPVLWKERHAGRAAPTGRDRPARVLAAVFAVCAVALFVGGGWTLVKRAVRALDPDEAALMLRADAGSRGVNGAAAGPGRAGVLLVTAGVFASGLYLLPLAVGVTGAVAGERFRGTLDSLLATPLDRREVLRSKVRAHAERGLVYAGGAAAALGAGFGVEGGAGLGFAALAAFAAGVGLVVGLGAWLSVRCALPTRAFRLCLPVAVLVGGSPVLVWTFTDWENAAASAEVLVCCAGVLAALGATLWHRAGSELGRGG